MAKRLHQRILLLRTNSGQSQAGKIKAHLAHSGSQSEHRIHFILPICIACVAAGRGHETFAGSYRLSATQATFAEPPI